MYNRGDKVQHGFTLIELLIVVAIIAILAAIAIPNFLAAQVRAKVSRTKGEMRSMATALEAYYVDNNNYPHDPGTGEIVPDPGTTEVDGQGNPTYITGIWVITTPIAYITSLPNDVFRVNAGWPPNNSTYVYYCDGSAYAPSDWPVISNEWWQWYMFSFGPDQVSSWNDNYQVLYDPSNGTVSNGDICRFGP